MPDAIWFSENSSDLLEIPSGMSNPQSIRQWFNDQQAIWFAENLPMIGKTEEGLTHPVAIRPLVRLKF